MLIFEANDLGRGTANVSNARNLYFKAKRLVVHEARVYTRELNHPDVTLTTASSGNEGIARDKVMIRAHITMLYHIEMIQALQPP